ncbi:hypothetical protein [Bacillus sp. FJAT-42315]|uniref:hypothetical protein n=1 Tax=Bacillus sp. FJAT-42315 TaxID=2014077 RepID=UPI000C24C25E|nr:hypothetical protein [Bacillus sp. FJAT-42315]
MNVLKSQKGNTLILVLLMTVIFTTIGLAIISFSIGGTKRTSVREEEINKTYEAIKVIDQITAELSLKLQSDDNQIYIPTNNEKFNTLTPANVSQRLEQMMTDLKTVYKKPENGVEEITFTDITDDYSVERGNTLTRVYSLSVTTKTREGNGNMTRTANKRLIFSPIPSFLKYALGSEKGELSLNGSPHIEGNIFANQLTISEQAEFLLSKDRQEQTATPLPSIYGDLYAGTYMNTQYESDDFNLEEMLAVLQPDHFYKGKVPDLKHDSQYQEIHFDDAFNEERTRALHKVNFSESSKIQIIDNLATNIAGVPPILENQLTINKETGEKIRPEWFELTDPSFDRLELEGNLRLLHSTKGLALGDVFINGDLTIITDGDLTLDNVYTTGTLRIVNNGHLTINGEVVAGKLSIDNQQQMLVKGDIYTSDDFIIKENSGSIEFEKKAQASGEIYVDNQKEGTLAMNDGLLTEDKLTVINKGKTTVTGNILSAKNLTITNDGSLTITNNESLTLPNYLFSYEAIKLDLSSTTRITGDIFSTASTQLLIKNNAQKEIVFEGNLFAGAAPAYPDAVNEKIMLTIQGDAQGEESAENDVFTANGVIYSSDRSQISNLKIEGKQDGQLVLLSKGKLLITRINEFSNFDPSKEDDDIYLPAETGVSHPLKLKGFFYTDDTAELYGVGSLFYIEGGLFSKNELTINALRGEVTDIHHAMSKSVQQQEDYYSRFIVDYNDEILLQNFDALPKVKYLSIYSAELTVE